MVTEFGMSKQIGPLSLGGGQPGYDGADYRGYGEEMARQVDAEVRQVVATAHARATRVLHAHRDIVEQAARLLVEREVLDADELVELFAGARNSPAGEPPTLPPVSAESAKAAPGPGLVRRERRFRLRSLTAADRPAFASTRRSSRPS
jgi:hypothetical protein